MLFEGSEMHHSTTHGFVNTPELEGPLPHGPHQDVAPGPTTGP